MARPSPRERCSKLVLDLGLLGRLGTLATQFSRALRCVRITGGAGSDVASPSIRRRGFWDRAPRPDGYCIVVRHGEHVVLGEGRWRR